MSKKLFATAITTGLLGLAGCAQDNRPSNVGSEDNYSSMEVQYTRNELEAIPANNFTVVNDAGYKGYGITIPVENVLGCYQAAEALTAEFNNYLNGIKGICLGDNAETIAIIRSNSNRTRVEKLNIR